MARGRGCVPYEGMRQRSYLSGQPFWAWSGLLEVVEPGRGPFYAPALESVSGQMVHYQDLVSLSPTEGDTTPSKPKPPSQGNALEGRD